MIYSFHQKSPTVSDWAATCVAVSGTRGISAANFLTAPPAAGATVVVYESGIGGIGTSGPYPCKTGAQLFFSFDFYVTRIDPAACLIGLYDGAAAAANASAYVEVTAAGLMRSVLPGGPTITNFAAAPVANRVYRCTILANGRAFTLSLQDPVAGTTVSHSATASADIKVGRLIYVTAPGAGGMTGAMRSVMLSGAGLD